MELADLVVLLASDCDFDFAVLSRVWLAATLGVVAASRLVGTFLLGWGSSTYHRGMLGRRCDLLRLQIVSTLEVVYVTLGVVVRCSESSDE